MTLFSLKANNGYKLRTNKVTMLINKVDKTTPTHYQLNAVLLSTQEIRLH